MIEDDAIRKKIEEKKENRDYYSINENLLQSYRQIFISAESFLLAVGILALDRGIGVFFGIATFSILMIWAGWYQVVKARHRIVDYYKYCLDIWKVCSLNDYVKDPYKRELANKKDDYLAEKSNWRETRIKVDGILPILFTLVWIVLILSYELNPYQTIGQFFLESSLRIFQ